MRQALEPGALGWPRGIGWRGRWEGGSGWGTHVNPWLIHINVWQKPLQNCKEISLQLIKINGEKKVDWQKALEIKCWASMPKFNYWTHFFPLQNNKNMLKHEDPLVVSCFLCAICLTTQMPNLVFIYSLWSFRSISQNKSVSRHGIHLQPQGILHFSRLVLFVLISVKI